MKRYFLAQWILPVCGPAMPDAFLAVEAGRIVAVGKRSDLSPQQQAEATAFPPHALVTPGLVNTHAHLELSFQRVIPNPPPGTMTDWLMYVVAQVSQDSTAEAKQARCRIGVAEMLHTGTTCVNDISSDGASLAVLKGAGLRGVVSLEFFHPHHETVAVEHVLQRYAAMADEADDFVKIGLSPHSPYNVSPKAWQTVLAACRPAVVHTHLAESQDEVAWIKGAEPDPNLNRLHQRVLKQTFSPQTTGLSPTRYLDAFGLLEPRLIAAHGVYTDAADRFLWQTHGVRLAHCPRSNHHLQGTTFGWEDWRELKVPVGLGTDSHLSTESLDLRAEARAAMAVHGWTAEEALRVMTLGGAEVMGLTYKVGTLEPGKAADFVCWVPQATHRDTAPEAQVLSNSTHCHSVYVAGETLLCQNAQNPVAGV
jgi:cytosine/adenosine deaminase-related metal-dependent hydrolase